MKKEEEKDAHLSTGALLVNPTVITILWIWGFGGENAFFVYFAFSVSPLLFVDFNTPHVLNREEAQGRSFKARNFFFFFEKHLIIKTL